MFPVSPSFCRRSPLLSLKKIEILALWSSKDTSVQCGCGGGEGWSHGDGWIMDDTRLRGVVGASCVGEQCGEVQSRKSEAVAAAEEERQQGEGTQKLRQGRSRNSPLDVGGKIDGRFSFVPWPSVWSYLLLSSTSRRQLAPTRSAVETNESIQVKRNHAISFIFWKTIAQGWKMTLAKYITASIS
jgi:hypothetical protein